MNFIDYVKQTFKNNFWFWMVVVVIVFVTSGIENCVGLNVSVPSYGMLLSSSISTVFIILWLLGIHYEAHKIKFFKKFTDTMLIQITLVALECVSIFEIFLLHF